MHLALQFYKNASSQVLWWINAVRYFFLYLYYWSLYQVKPSLHH